MMFRASRPSAKVATHRSLLCRYRTSHPNGKLFGYVEELEDIRRGTQRAWDRFYSWPNVWERSRVVTSLKARLAFVLVSRLYRQMYANTGIATDSARVARSTRWARWLGLATRRLFLTTPMPHLQVPEPEPAAPITLLTIGRR